MGPYLNYEMLFGPFSGYLQAGVYLNNYQKEYSFTVDYPDGPHTHTTAFLRSPVFNRVGLRYRFKPNIVLALGLAPISCCSEYRNWSGDLLLTYYEKFKSTFYTLYHLELSTKDPGGFGGL
ncbi:MAG: hypothetical protein U5L96_14070 [Owenweeksia sp.]|nr:hypothetical protein [Owenweeksia sp.]